MRLANQSGFSKNFDKNTGVYTVSGTKTLAQYRDVLRKVRFYTTSEQTQQRTIEFQVTDTSSNGAANSIVVTRTISLTGVNDPPIVSLTVPTSALVYVENSEALGVIPNNLAITDDDNDNIQNVTLVLSPCLPGDTLAASDAVYDFGAGCKLTFSQAKTKALMTSAVQAVTYVSNSNAISEAVRTIAITAFDLESASVANRTSFQVKKATPQQCTVTAPSGTLEGGTPFPTQPIVTVKDGAGVIIQSFAGAVTLANSDSGGSQLQGSTNLASSSLGIAKDTKAAQNLKMLATLLP